MTESEKPYVTIQQVAAYFQVARSTIRNWMTAGKIPADTYIKIGDVYRFRLDAVEAALTEAPKQVQVDALTPDEGE